jgi:hypothetical protein
MPAMRARLIAGVAVVGALAAAPSAGAAEHIGQVRFRTSGSIRVAWHGAPARGCAAAGLCAYSGSIAYPLRGGRGFLELEPETFLPFFGEIESRRTARTRTERALPGGGTAVCSQRRRFTSFTLGAERAWRGRDWLSVDAHIFPPPIASGQCAGPRIDDFVPTLPSALVRRKAIKKRGTRVSLKGRFPFRAGPLTGQVISTLVLTSRGVHRIRVFGEREEPERERGHQLSVELRYDVKRIQGEVRNDFRAVDAPICRLRDACGTHGSQVWSLDEAARTLVFSGFARVRSRHRPSLKRALRKVVRDGFADGFLPIGRRAGLTSHAYLRPGAATCTDRFRPHQQPSRFLDGRCPGPTDSSAGDIAHARVPRGRLLKRALTLELRRRRSFESGAYSGARTVRVNVRLRRTHARVRIDPRFGGGSGGRVFAFSEGVSTARSAP